MARKLITVDSSTNELPADSKFATGGYIETQVDEKISGKQDAGNYVLTSDSRLTDTRTPKSHTHAIADTSGLQSALDAKQGKGDYILDTDSRLSDARTPKTHTHAIADTSGLQTALDAKAASSHTHTIANVTGLQAALDAKATASALSDLVARVEALESPA